MTHSTKKRTTTKRTKARKPAAKPTNRPRRQTAKGHPTSLAPAAINKIAAATFSVDELLKCTAEPLDFVLPGLLIGTVSLLLGAGGVGKSNFAVQTSISVGIGRDVFNLWGDARKPFKMKKGKVLYISAEDGKRVVAERLKNAREHLTRTQKRVLRENVQFTVPSSFSIVTRKDGQLVESDWIRDLHDILREMPEKPRLIIIDTLNRSLGDANENSSTGMAKIEDALKVIAEAYSCGVQLVHHTVKGIGDGEAGLRADVARGSSAAVSNVRSVINLSPDDADPNVIWYAVTKANYGSKPPMRFAVRMDDGVLFGLAQHPNKPPAAESVISDSSPSPDLDETVGKSARKSTKPVSTRPGGEPKSSASPRLN